MNVTELLPTEPDARRLVIVVRADPVICGHSGEARCLAETALERGFTEVRIVTWPLAALETAGLPLKPLAHVQPYSPGIIVERPEPVGDYRVPDGRGLAGVASARRRARKPGSTQARATTRAPLCGPTFVS